MSTYSLYNSPIADTFQYVVQTRDGQYYDGLGNYLNIPIGVNYGTGLSYSGSTLSVDANVITSLAELNSRNYLTQSALTPYATTATLSNYVTSVTLAGYNYVTASIVNGYLTQSALTPYATASNVLQNGNSFGATFTIGSKDDQNLSFLQNNSPFLIVQKASYNATVGSPNMNIMFNGLTAGAVFPTTTGGVATFSTLFVQGNSVLANGISSVISTLVVGGSSGLSRPHIRMQGAAGNGWFGMRDNSTILTYGLGANEYYTLSTPGHNWFVTSQSGGTTLFTFNAAMGNSSGQSVGLNVLNTGSNTSTGGQVAIKVNNTQTLSGTGTQSFIELHRNSQPITWIDMNGRSNYITGTTSAVVGTVSLVAGAAMVTNLLIRTASIVMLTPQGSILGTPYISGRTVGASFSIASTNNTDTAVIGWQIIN